MTGILNPNQEPGESEYSHGKGLMASDAQRAQYHDPIDPEGPWEPSVYEQGKAIQRTNPADPDAIADYGAAPGTASNWTEQEWVRE